MGFYMKIDGIKGGATAKGYEDWIVLTRWGSAGAKAISTSSGSGKNRQSSKASMSEFQIGKETCPASPILWKRSVTAGVEGTDILVHITNAQDLPILEITLKEAVLAAYSWGDDGESYSINYTKMEKKFTDYDANGKALSPISADHDIAAAV